MAKQRVNAPWTTYPSSWVEEIPGEPFRYYVQSESRPEIFHMVDLTENDGNGCCTCENFQMVAYPNWKRHGKWIPYAPGRQGCSECRHIRAALDHFHETVTRPMLAGFKAGIPAQENPARTTPGGAV